MCTPEPPSAELVDAVAAVMRHHGQKWLRFVVRVLGNPADAEDVVQEAVQRVLLRGRPFPDEDQARMYLSRAVCNGAIEAYHRKKRERLMRVPLQEDALAQSNTVSPQYHLEEAEALAVKNHLIGLINQGLSTLPAKQYEAVRLTIMDSELTSIREAVALNGIPYSTLRHRRVQGVHQLRKFVRRALRSSALKSLMA